MRCTPLLLVPGLLVGCSADSSTPPDGPTILIDDETSSGWNEWIEDAPREIDADIFIFPESCERPIVDFEATAQYRDDLSPVPSFACLWTFDDGTTSNECSGRHEFSVAGAHDFILDVEDLETGAMAHAEQTRIIQPPLEANLDVSTPACGLEISWVATVNVAAEVHVTVEPFDQIITDDPDYHQNRTLTLPVRAPGEYTVVMDVEEERGVSEICSARIEKIVTVTECPHEHTPDCDHHEP